MIHRTLPAGKQLRLEALAPALVHWSADGLHTTFDTETCDTRLGVHVADLPIDDLAVGATSNSRSTGPQWVGGKVSISPC